MKHNTFIGIDPGKSGAIVVINNHNSNIGMYKIPLLTKKEYNVPEFLRLMKALKESEDSPVVVIEDVHAIPGKGAKQTFEFGKGVMLVEVAVVAAGLAYIKVQPKAWQKEALQGVSVCYKGKTAAGKDKVDTKGMALVAATRLFPNTEFHFGGRASVPHDGIVDALLMAYYAKIQNK